MWAATVPTIDAGTSDGGKGASSLELHWLSSTGYVIPNNFSYRMVSEQMIT